MKKTIFIFNDGTGQYLKSEAVTNVAKLYRCRPGEIGKQNSADEFKIDSSNGNVSIYIRGIGTIDNRFVQEPKDQSIWDKICSLFSTKARELGEQVSGTTIIDRVQRSYDLFNEFYAHGDDIILVGFSRGAASIRILASELVKRHNVNIKYMLVFDTVYSVMGQIKILDNAPTDRFADFDLSPKILQCDHLIAGDEMREKFPISPINKREGVRQVLFAGSHSDVGGGHSACGLSDISLSFALEQLRSYGYDSDAKALASLNVAPNIQQEITFVVLGGTGQRHFPRKLQELEFVVHRSVIDRSAIRGAVSIALAQLSTFTTKSGDELVNPKDIDSSFDL